LAVLEIVSFEFYALHTSEYCFEFYKLYPLNTITWNASRMFTIILTMLIFFPREFFILMRFFFCNLCTLDLFYDVIGIIQCFIRAFSFLTLRVCVLVQWLKFGSGSRSICQNPCLSCI